MAIEKVFIHRLAVIISKVITCMQRWRTLLKEGDKDRLEDLLLKTRGWIQAFAENSRNETDDVWLLDRGRLVPDAKTLQASPDDSKREGKKENFF